MIKIKEILSKDRIDWTLDDKAIWVITQEEQTFDLCPQSLIERTFHYLDLHAYLIEQLSLIDKKNKRIRVSQVKKLLSPEQRKFLRYENDSVSQLIKAIQEMLGGRSLYGNIFSIKNEPKIKSDHLDSEMSFEKLLG